MRETAMLAVLLTAPAVAVVDGFIAVVALPSIQSQIGASDAGAELVIAGYSLAYATFLITAGRLGDLFGRRRLLVIGLATFGGTSLAAGLAPNEDVLLGARIAQGGAAALMYPQALEQLQTMYRGRGRAIAMGAYGLTLGLAGCAAPLVGGVLVQSNVFGLGWRSIFVVNVPITAAAGLAALRILPSRGRDQGGPGLSLDVIGLTALTLGLSMLVLPLVVGRELGWPWWTWPGLAGAVVVAVLFVLHERSTACPLLDLDLFRRRTFVVGLLATVPFYAGEVGYLVLLSIYVRRGMDLQPLTAGLMVMSVAVGFSVASAALPFIRARVGRLVLTVGPATTAAGTSGLIVLVMAGSAVPAAILPSVLCVAGMGFGLTIPSLVGMALGDIPQDTAGAAAGALVTAQQVSGALGVAISGVVFFGLLRVVRIGSAYAWALGLDVALFVATAMVVQVVCDER